MNKFVVQEDVERMNFEAWCKTQNPSNQLKTVVDDDGDVCYEDIIIDSAWQGWIARAYKSVKSTQEKTNIKKAVLKAAESSEKSPEALAESLIKAIDIIEKSQPS